jgi:hypothetical protein
MSANNIESVIALHGTKEGKISIAKIEEPYGEGSGTVASIGITLNGNVSEPDWKVHIPIENLSEVIAALEVLR